MASNLGPLANDLTYYVLPLVRNADEIAKKRRVFKVETVGDCYVAGM